MFTMIKLQRKNNETLNLLNTLEPIKLKKGEEVKLFSNEELKNYRKILKEIYPKGTSVKNIDTGISISFTNAGSGHTGTGNLQDKLELIKNLSEIVEKSIYIGLSKRNTEPFGKTADKKLKQIQHGIKYHLFANKIDINNEIIPVSIIVMETSNGNFHYDSIIERDNGKVSEFMNKKGG